MGAMLAFLGVTLVYPIALTVDGAFLTGGSGQDAGRFTTEHIRLVFSDPGLVAGLVNSAKIGIATTAVCLLIGLPLALFSARYLYPCKAAFNAMILVPLILPPFVGAIGLQSILGREGALNSLTGWDTDVLGSAKFWGVVIVEALHLYPIVYLNATAALANLDPAMDEAAENLGAGALRRFFTITLPLIRPGLFAGCTIVFIWAFTELGTPLVFDYNQVTPVQIFFGLKEVESSPQPYALTVVMLAASVLIYGVGKVLFGQRGHAMYSKASRAGGEVPLGTWAGWGVAGAFGLVTFVALLPHIGVVLTAVAQPGSWYRSALPRGFTLSHFEQALSSPEAFGSIVNSLHYSIVATIIDILLGLAAAYLIVRTTVRGRHLLDALCMLPLAVPGLVLAFGYTAMTLKWPFSKGAPLEGMVSVFGADPNPVILLIVIFAVRRLPYLVRSSIAGLEQTSGELEEAAMNLGASRFRAVRRVILPLIMANLIAGALLAFSNAMLGVSEALVLAQQEKYFPITRAIYAFLNRLGDGPYIASAMGVWAMALLTVTLVGASVLMGKKLGSIFRV
ncbi:MAG: iron ABC transporter permease [Phycisphaeraceae bacterium]|nr:iron ABC transporter permease [Phycisphaeraceae bacterium]